MRLNFYDTMVTDDGTTVLVKEKGVNYESDGLNAPEPLANMLREVVKMDTFAEERCYVVAQNSSGRVLGIFFVTKGAANFCYIGTREVFIRALLVGANKIVLCHNHPSKDCNPSRSDMLLTERMKQAGELLGIPVIDHIIICGDKYISFLEKNLM